jgi:hypothetical protein
MSGNKVEGYLTVFLDSKPPNIIVEELNSSESIKVKNNRYYQIKGKTIENKGIKDNQVVINGTKMYFSFEYILNLKPGNNIVKIETTDIAGNDCTKTYSINYAEDKILKPQIGSKTM